MNLKNCLLAGIVAAALSVTAFTAEAQSAGTKPAAPAATPAAAAAPAAPASATSTLPEDAATANRPATQNWLKVCGNKAPDGSRACIMRQIVFANQQFLGSFLLRDDPGQQSRLLAVAAVPLGVLLPFNLTWQIDGGKPIRVPFMLCDPQSCASQLVINEQYVAAMKKGSKLTLTAKTRQNKDLVVEFNLAGFGTVYDSQDAMTFDQYNKDTTGGAALQQVLQDRAEQLRKQLDAGTTDSTTTPTTPSK